VNDQACGLVRQFFESYSFDIPYTFQTGIMGRSSSERVSKASQGAIMIIRALKANRSHFLRASVLLTLGLLTSISTFAQTFNAAPQLAFTKPFAGTDPLPQILTVASTGANFNFSATATTSSGGSWLSISPAGNDCCTTPAAITVTVAAPPALAAGTYTGQISLASYPTATITMNVAVTLTVASGGAFFDNVPGQLSFSLMTGGAAPPYQPVQIRNKGTGSLSWTVAKSTADGGNWLGVTPTSGVAPSNLAVAIVPGNLPGGGLTAGTFVGELVFTAAGSSVTIPISVAVGASVFSQVNPISFTMPLAGANPLPQVLTIASPGSAFNFSVAAATSTGGAWLQVSPTGNDCCTTPEAVTVSITAPAGLAAGTYTGEVTFTQYPNRSLSMTVPVTLTVAAPTVSFLDNLPGQLSFSLKTAGAAPPYQLVQIRNKGTGTLGWSLVKGTADGGNWLGVSTTQGNAPSTIAVSVTPANLPGGGLVAGTFVGQILVATATSSVSIPVVVVVGDSVFSQANPISFTMPLAGANPLPQVLTIGSTGSAFNFSVTASTATGGAWLQVSPSGNDCCTTPEAITVSITAPAGLAVGTYTGEVTFTQYPNRSLSLTVPVTLTVAAPTVSFLDNLPGQLSFSLKTAGAAPPYQLLQIRNRGTGTLGWSLVKGTADGGNWLNVSATTGNAPSTIAVSITPANLPNGGLVAGTFVGQILVATATSSVSIPVVVAVGDSVFSQVNPIGFTMPLAGANPLPQVISVGSTDSPFNFSVTASTATGGAWLQVSPSGNDCCTTPEAITVSITAPAGLAVGTYTGEITFTQYSSRSLSMTVPVTLTVAAPTVSFLDNLPGQLSFSLKTGGAAPPYQLFQIRNAGTGTLGWSLITSTADGGSWLGASATKGNAPSTVAIAIVPGNLPSMGLVPGTFVGEITILTASATATIPVTVVVGDSVFTQVNALSFTMPAGGSNPLPQLLTAASTDTAFNFTASAVTATGGSWLQISPTGNDCCTTPEAIMVSITAPPGLAPGTYTGEIVLTEYSGRSLSMTVPVTLTVAPVSTAFLDNLPGQLSFSIKTGGLPPPYQLVQIRNGGTGTLAWGLAKSTADGGNWLNVSATQGTAPSTLAVSITPANLPGGGLVAGTFVGEVLIETASSNVSIPINVIIGDPVFSQVNPLRFTMPAGGNDPLPQIVTVATTSTAFNFTATAATGTGGSWLQISPHGTDCCTASEAFTVSVTAPASLAAGTYTGEIILVSYSSGNRSMTIPVTLTVNASGAFFDNVIGQLGFFMSTGGTAPASQVVQIRNGGTGTLTWGSVASTADSGKWISITPTQGGAPSSATVSITPANLPNGGLVAGTYTGQILLASAADGVTIPVSLVVGDPGFVTSPVALSFSMSAGGSNPASQPITITSTTSAFNFSATAETGTGGNWLQISPKGNDCCTTGTTITVSVTAPASMPVGTYTGQISLIQYSSGNKAVTVPVYLTVH
jgi:hypothetical protein